MKQCSYHGSNPSHETEECRVLLSQISLGNSKGEPNKHSGPRGRNQPRQAKARKPKQPTQEPNKTEKSETNKDTETTIQEKTDSLPTKNPPKQKNKKTSNYKQKKPNTTDFTPSYDPPDLRVRFFVPSTVGDVLKDELTVQDVCYVPSLFCEQSDTSVYENILKEVTAASNKKQELFIEWHGDSHVIANDKVGGNWKARCPTLLSVLEKMEKFFDFTTNATRVNWYRPGSEDWKPYHHDRAAFTPGEPQNFTIAASFGCTREVGFEHTKNKTRVFLPVANGSAYTFCRDVNIEWKHGVIPSKQKLENGRISIIAWGLRNQNASSSRVTTNDVPSAADLGIK